MATAKSVENGGRSGGRRGSGNCPKYSQDASASRLRETGTHRQADLIKLVVGFSSSLLS
jgi:hypothetical protein